MSADELLMGLEQMRDDGRLRLVLTAALTTELAVCRLVNLDRLVDLAAAQFHRLMVEEAESPALPRQLSLFDAWGQGGNRAESGKGCR